MDDGRADTEERADVVLISMPFTRLAYPSIGLSLLRSVLVPLGVRVKILYFGLPFAKRIGIQLYQQITELGAQRNLMGEWVFARALFEPRSPAEDGEVGGDGGDGEDGEDGYAHEVLSRYDEEFIRQTLSVRHEAESFLDNCCAEVLRYRPAIVGFTSVFQQHVPSLALASRIKAHAPEKFIVFGGANCESVMGAETIRQFQFVDAAVSGEGEIVFPELVQRVLQGKPGHDIAGVYTRNSIAAGGVNSRYPNAPRVRELDVLPFPDYDDFFSQYARQWEPADSAPPPEMLFETSRGCWWGEKQHCTFCGLSEDVLVFRSKSGRRAMDELQYLVDRYPVKHLGVVDNIMDMKYFKDFIPELAARRLGVTLFYEVKANLKKDQVRLMRDAGIVSIQPGIESFSSPILQQMRKGITGLRNIQVLKWCQELGIVPTWILLWGFPGESPDEYTRMSDLIPLLTHLYPPDGGMAIRLERFSPNFEDAEKLGFTDVLPSRAYFHIYPFAQEVVANLAYFFTYGYQKRQDPRSYTDGLKKKIAAWKRDHSKESLVMTDKGTHLELVDTRAIAPQGKLRLSGLERTLYLACDRICTVKDLAKPAADYAGRLVSPEEIATALQSLVDRLIMMEENCSYLSLAIDPFARMHALQRRKLEPRLPGNPSHAAQVNA